MKECMSCGFNDEDYGCACPSSDKWYACPIENKKPENIKDLKEYAEWAMSMDNCKDAFLRLTTEIETTISNCRVYAKVMRLVETNNSRKRNHKPMRRWRWKSERCQHKGLDSD